MSDFTANVYEKCLIGLSVPKSDSVMMQWRIMNHKMLVIVLSINLQLDAIQLSIELSARRWNL